jgi:hypothetical protein
MKLLAIDIDETRNVKFRENPECIPGLDIMPDYYRKVSGWSCVHGNSKEKWI